MTPDWPSLWDRDEALHPTVYIGLMEAWTREMVDNVNAALARDAAVRWIYETVGKVCIGRNRVQYYGTGVDNLKSNHFGKSTDAALFAACTAILDARDAATPK